MSRRVTVLLLSPDGRTTRRLELSLPRVVLLGTAAVVLVCVTLWLGWGLGAFTAGLG